MYAINTTGRVPPKEPAKLKAPWDSEDRYATLGGQSKKLADNKLQVANREIARLTVALKSAQVGAEVAVSEIARKKTKKRNERPENSAPKPHKDDFLRAKCSHDGCTIHGTGLIKDNSFCRCCWKKWYCRHHVGDLEDHRPACEAAKSLPNSPVRKKLVADRGTTNN